MARLRTWRFWSALAVVATLAATTAALLIWNGDVLQALLDPEAPTPSTSPRRRRTTARRAPGPCCRVQ